MKFKQKLAQLKEDIGIKFWKNFCLAKVLKNWLGKRSTPTIKECFWGQTFWNVSNWLNLPFYHWILFNFNNYQWKILLIILINLILKSIKYSDSSHAETRENLVNLQKTILEKSYAWTFGCGSFSRWELLWWEIKFN